jgi:hypothetical protein
MIMAKTGILAVVLKTETPMSSGRGSYMTDENQDALTSSTRPYAKSRGYIQTFVLSISV